MSQGYGSDTFCLDSLRPGLLASGAALVLQACYRRLITPRGTLQGGDEESAYGFDLAGYIGASGIALSLVSLPGLIAGELKKDDRVAEVDCVASQTIDSAGAISITLVISVTLADGSGTFPLTLAANDTSVSILGLAA